MVIILIKTDGGKPILAVAGTISWSGEPGLDEPEKFS